MYAVESQMAAAATSRQREVERQDAHLRSVNEVRGYHIEAADGEFGHVDDFIVDDEDWAIRFIVVKTGGWLFGRKTLIQPQWIEGISWNESKMFVNLTREQIEDSPEYDESAPISREYEESLRRHYGRPGHTT